VASFVGFAPSRAPRVAVLVVLDEPRGGLYHGGQIAAPAARRILEPVLGLLGVPADGRAVEVALRDFYPPPDGVRDFSRAALARR
jgi:hypothetical protein